MTDDSPPTKSSTSWNFDDLQNDDDADSGDDFFSVLKKKVAQRVYLDEPSSPTEKKAPSERSSTVRVDGSALISRCKQFLPLLTDANRTLLSQIQSGENVRIELDSDHDDDAQRIEMNLMFCPSSESEDDSDDSDDEAMNPQLLQISQDKKPVSIVELPSAESTAPDDKPTDDLVNN